MDSELEGVIFTPLLTITDERGEVRRGLKASDGAFCGFGEIYFSSVNQGIVKGWKKHSRMQSNLIVLSGEIRFVVFDDRLDSCTHGKVGTFVLSKSANYGRLFIPSGLWLAFQGLSAGINQLVNIASIEHDPDESEVRQLDDPSMPAIDWK